MSYVTRSLAIFSVLLVLSSCSDSESEEQEAVQEPPAAAAEPAEEATEAAEEATEPAEETAAPADLDTAAMAAVVERTGAPMFEGATPLRLEQGEDEVKAVYLTQESFRTVKAYYDEQLTEPGWTNNGFSMGPFGGSGWQYDSAEGDLKVVVSDEDEGTEVRFIHPAS